MSDLLYFLAKQVCVSNNSFFKLIPRVWYLANISTLSCDETEKLTTHVVCSPTKSLSVVKLLQFFIFA